MSYMQGQTYTRQLEKLKGDVKMMLGEAEKPLHQLELIDTLQRLGIHYHFGEEIKREYCMAYTTTIGMIHGKMEIYMPQLLNLDS